MDEQRFEHSFEIYSPIIIPRGLRQKGAGYMIKGISDEKYFKRFLTSKWKKKKIFFRSIDSSKIVKFSENCVCCFRLSRKLKIRFNGPFPNPHQRLVERHADAALIRLECKKASHYRRPLRIPLNGLFGATILPRLVWIVRSPSYRFVFFHSSRNNLREGERDFKSLVTLRRRRRKKDKDLFEIHLRKYYQVGKDEFARLTNGQRSSTVMQLNP